MGLKNPFIKQMIQWIKDDFESLDNIKMLEFGSQVVRPVMDILKQQEKIYGLIAE